jgi:hypothetical protein
MHEVQAKEAGARFQTFQLKRLKVYSVVRQSQSVGSCEQ